MQNLIANEINTVRDLATQTDESMRTLPSRSRQISEMIKTTGDENVLPSTSRQIPEMIDMTWDPVEYLRTITTTNLFPGDEYVLPSTSRQIPEMIDMSKELTPMKWSPVTYLREITQQQNLYGSGIDAQPAPPPLHFRNIHVIQELSERHIKKYNTTCKNIRFNFIHPASTVNPLSYLQDAFEELLEYISRDAVPSDRVGLTLRNPNFPERPIGVSFRRVDQLSVSVIMSALERILQSNANFFATDVMTLQVDKVVVPVGYGRKKLTGLRFDDFCKAKTRGFIVVPDMKDNRCLVYALILAIAHRSNDPMLTSMKNNRGPLLRQRAMHLCQVSGVDLSQGGSYEHIQAFQNYLHEYTIVVYNSRIGNSVYFEGPQNQGRVVLNLMLESGHYNVIISLTSAFTCGYFCVPCRYRYNDKKQHANCMYQCPCCHQKPPCSVLSAKIVCNICHRDFHGDACLKSHQESGLCERLRRCMECLKSFWVNDINVHKCGQSYCKVCKKVLPYGHLCYMPVNKVKKSTGSTKPSLFIFYDLECMQEKAYMGMNERFLHECNLCVAASVCEMCVDKENVDEVCEFCGSRLHIFREDPVNSFLQFVAERGRNFSVTCIAHNMKGYDGCFVLRAMFGNINRWNPQVISNGLKLISIKCGDIRFIDSLNFIPLPLSAIPKTFDFPESKGYFPYLFNTTENQNYVGPLPELKYYSPDDMSTKDRAKFLDWYNQEIRNGVVFRMAEEIINYCVMDVKILLKGCIRFWKIFKGSNYVDPFTEACTIASACNKVFRRRFLTPNTIGLIPTGGYRMADTQSKLALQWLRWIEHSQQISIQHAGNAREYRIPEGVKVDGYCRENNTIYEFLGCYWHGCEYCFPNQANFDSELPTDRAMFIRNENTVARSQFLRSRGYNLVEMKECAFKKLVSSNDQIKAFVDGLGNGGDNMDPLNPRDAFFGGRTNASTLYYKCDGISEKILYYDVCSLYPFVNKYRKYPVGHPQIHVGNENCLKLSIDTVEGLVKCRVLPPDDLYHPVLPMRMHGKLMFALCRTCCIELNEGDCGHSEHERSFVGTFVADELRKALSKDYKILAFYEIWEYKVVQYDKISKQDGLFSGYIDNFLKLKQECSGWPSDCTTDTEKLAYIETFFKKEGIQLDFNNMRKNPGLRYLAKLMLNSFWGKFGQRENLVRCSIVSEPKDFFKLLTNPLIQIQSIISVNDDVMVVNWDRVEGEGTPLQTVNVAIAAYTTAHARLELYGYLEKLDRRVLYYDTDSIIFVQRPGDWHPVCGDFLGQMTDELESYGAGSYISEFCSGGPKNYSYKVYATSDCSIKTICKVKGITLNFKNSKIININAMREMVLTNSKASIFVNNDRKIIRDKQYNVVSRPEKKQYRINYSKRRRIESFDTLPFGYKGIG